MAFLVHDDGLWQAFKVTFDLTGAPRFPMVRLSVAVATVLVASPHLARPTRRFGEGLVALLALSSLYLSRGFPTDLIAAIVLGWGVAHLVEWVFGTPVGRPARRQVQEALAKLGVPVTDLHLTSEQPVGRAVFVADRADGHGPVRDRRARPRRGRRAAAVARVALRRVPRRAADAAARAGARRWSTRPT